jgi:hypothetical protein
MPNKETLEERQQAMKDRIAKERATREDLATRPKCVSCKTRYARLNSPFCSRCSISSMTTQLRDTLPGVKHENNSIPDHSSNVHSDVPSITHPDNNPAPVSFTLEGDQVKYYTRAQVAELLKISCTTISRWEKKGRVPAPKRTVHNNQCLYTEDNIKALKAYRDAEYTPSSSTSSTGVASLPRAIKKAMPVKLNKRMERVVASRFGGGLLH